jgi:sugar phosphate isomerase/epimerase
VNGETIPAQPAEPAASGGPRLVLGADTLCWHLRLETGDISLEQLLEEASAAGARFVQLTLHHARERSVEDLAELARRADGLGLHILASGDFLGGARFGDEPSAAAERVRGWLERALALGSPILRVTSGFYRADLATRPDAIEAERRWVIEALLTALPDARDAGVTIALENHADFSVAEYRSIVEAVADEHAGVFLDVINPIAALEDPVPVVKALAPLSVAGHVKDFELESIQTEGGYHRRGFSVLYRYPGEGAANLAEIWSALAEGLAGRELPLAVEGLDNRAEVRDQAERLRRSFEHLRGLVPAPAGA